MTHDGQIDFKVQFKSPPKGYGPVAFWSLNDRLDENEVRRQVGDLADAHLGGFFMHAREGLETPYLSDEWFDRLKVAVSEAGRLGLEAWIYDEDKYPSGYAGGAVPLLSPSYRSSALVFHEGEMDTEPDEDAQLITRYVERSGAYEALDPHAPTNGQTVYHLYARTMQLDECNKRPIKYVTVHFNGTCYVDLLNPDTTDAFIQTTYEKYRECFGDHFGSTIPGAFTDEPAAIFRFGRMYTLCGTYWTPHLPTSFQERRGYDLRPHLISLFRDTGDYRKIRYDFNRTVGELFLENYTKRLYQWCDEHRLLLSGHYLEEDALLSQQRHTVELMPHYRHMHVPGIDRILLTNRGVVGLKQVSSVANQFGRQRRSSELYGLCGHQLSFELMKWLADWHFVLGINLLVPHMAQYSLRGRRKRDFPPTIFYQQPYWPHFPAMSDYLTRVSWLLSQGTAVMRLAVISPIESLWMHWRPDATAAAKEISDDFGTLAEQLLAMHHDYDLASETLMETDGSVRDHRFVIGQAEYEVVLVPFASTLREQTVKLLFALLKAGGHVVLYRSELGYQGGQLAPDMLQKLLAAGARNVESESELSRTLDDLLTADARIGGSGRDKVWCLEKLIEGRQWYFFANTSAEAEADVQITLPGRYGLRTWDAKEGTVETLPCTVQHGNDTSTFLKRFEPCESLLVSCEAVGDAPVQTPEAVKETRFDLHPRDGVKRTDHNALVLDYCTWRTTGSDWSDRVPVIVAAEHFKDESASAEARFRFRIDRVPAGAVHLVMETPDAFDVRLNDNPIPAPSDTWVDVSFLRIEVTDQLVVGSNILTLHRKPGGQVELETLYLTGDFGVLRTGEGAYVIDDELARIDTTRDLTGQGYPFYAGNFEVDYDIEMPEQFSGATLVLDHLDFTLVDVVVNDQRAGRIWCRPYRLPLETYVQPGPNHLKLTFVNTLRNLLGPHHTRDIDLAIYGITPEAFIPNPDWTDDYLLQTLNIGPVSILAN